MLHWSSTFLVSGGTTRERLCPALPRSRDDRLDGVGVVINFARLIHPQTFGAWLADARPQNRGIACNLRQTAYFR